MTLACECTSIYSARLARKELGALESLMVGRTVPDIVGEDLDGKPFRLTDYRGKVVVLDFGSQTYCSFCRDLIPHWRLLTKRSKASRLLSSGSTRIPTA